MIRLNLKKERRTLIEVKNWKWIQIEKKRKYHK